MKDELKAEIARLEPEAQYAIVFDDYLTMVDIDHLKKEIQELTQAKVLILCGVKILDLKNGVIVGEVITRNE